MKDNLLSALESVDYAKKMLLREIPQGLRERIWEEYGNTLSEVKVITLLRNFGFDRANGYSLLLLRTLFSVVISSAPCSMQLKWESAKLEKKG